MQPVLPDPGAPSRRTVTSETLADGRRAGTFELSNGVLRARVSSLGASLLALGVPDLRGQVRDVVLGHGTLQGYLGGNAYLGAAIGRTAGRIGDACVEVDEVDYDLAANDGADTLHGGPHGLHQKVWAIDEAAPGRIRFRTHSPDGEGGFPGALSVSLAYTLHSRELHLDWTATADAPTPFAPTHHAYWNLDGHDAGSIRRHLLQCPAERYVVLGRGLLPTGETAPVAGTPLDFRRPVPLGRVLDAPTRQVEQAGGIDHDLLDAAPGARQSPFRVVARLWGEAIGMDVLTTEPGVHVYTGGTLAVADGKGGARYERFDGIALETQPPPDAARYADAGSDFPDIILRPGDTFHSRTVYRFHYEPAPLG